MSRRQRLTLLAAICGSAVATIDGSIVNVALPAIERNLGGGLPRQQWVANAYLLGLALTVAPLTATVLADADENDAGIASAPEDDNLVLTVERLDDGEVSPYLVDELQPGDRFELRGPIGGYFVWEAALGGPLLLVAGGSGWCRSARSCAITKRSRAQCRCDCSIRRAHWQRSSIARS